MLFSYIGWVWSAPREIGQGEWKVKLPSGPSTLVQIVIGLFDLGFCALAMYMLLPGEPNIGFVTLLVVFVSATMLGFASHAPGGLGVFDAAMLVALWQFPKEDLVAGLLLFRVLYYLVPFVLALAILGMREFVLYAAPQGAAAAAQRCEVAEPLISEIERRENRTPTEPWRPTQDNFTLPRRLASAACARPGPRCSAPAGLSAAAAAARLPRARAWPRPRRCC